MLLVDNKAVLDLLRGVRLLNPDVVADQDELLLLHRSPESFEIISVTNQASSFNNILTSVYFVPIKSQSQSE